MPYLGAEARVNAFKTERQGSLGRGVRLKGGWITWSLQLHKPFRQQRFWPMMAEVSQDQLSHVCYMLQQQQGMDPRASEPHGYSVTFGRAENQGGLLQIG